MKKRIISLVVAVVMVMGMATGICAGTAESPYTVTMTAGENSAEIGSTVSVTVSVDPTGWKAMEAEISYDNDKLTLTTTADDLGTGYYLTDNDGSVTIGRFGSGIETDDAFVLVFTATAAGDAEIEIISADISGGEYSVSDDLVPAEIPEEATTITVNEPVTYTWEYIANEDYAALKQSTKVAILKTEKCESGTYALTGYGNMFWSSKYEGYAYIVAESETDETLTSKLTKSDESTVDLSYDKGDLNGSGKATAADSTPINAGLYGVNIDGYDSVKLRLEMDVNGDKTVSVTDIVWVLEEAVGLHEQD